METTDAPQMIEHKNVSLTYTPYETRWVPCSARFVCCGITPKAKGKLEVYELKQGKLEVVAEKIHGSGFKCGTCLLYTSPSPRDVEESRMPSSA